ncbi:MAG TPA: helix-turn-helix domain-containing protein [Candidatus Eisenbacteria bacterium]|nr:helix-turn-helix domain-containing protein [Candidatus Eisenbacteria bacterium]
MTSSSGRAFNDWLRSQLKAKKMSQRQLAQQSGVDHSTISRLIRGDRMPSLGTATKLARGLRELREEDDGPQYLRLVGAPSQNPTARVEYALRGDDVLSESHVRQVMEYYLAIRRRRLERTFPAPAASNGNAAASNGHAAASNGNAEASNADPAGSRETAQPASNGHAADDATNGHERAARPASGRTALAHHPERQHHPATMARVPYARSGNEAPVAVATRIQTNRVQTNRPR